MIVTLFLISLMVAGIAYTYRIWGHDYPKLAFAYLCSLPFLPIVLAINHNLENGSLFNREICPIGMWGNVVLMTPTYAVLTFLTVSRFRAKGRFRTRELGLAGGFLCAFIALTIPSIFTSTDPGWSFFAWSWVMPAYFLFFVAGRSTEPITLRKYPWALVAGLGVTVINLLFILLALRTGKAGELVMTRNFGSFYASNSAITVLILTSSLATTFALQRTWTALLFVLSSLTTTFVSISKTGLIFLAYLGFQLSLQRRIFAFRTMLALCAALVAVVAGVWTVSSEGARRAMTEGWQIRLQVITGQSDEDVEDVFARRRDEFEPVRDEVYERSNPLYGFGLGGYKDAWLNDGGYSNPHNVFLHEAAENGLVAAVVLVALFAIGSWSAIGALKNMDLRPISFGLWTYLFVAHITGNELSSRAESSYMTPFMGAAVFYMIGLLTRHSERPDEPLPE